MRSLALILSLTVAVLAHDAMKEHQDHLNAEGGHDATYDHQAFLGREAAEFDQLSPEQSKKRLRAFLPRIDTDNDTVITKDELVVHIRKMAKQYVRDNVDTAWKMHEKEVKDGKLSWPDYRATVTGVKDVNEPIKDEVYADMMRKDERRWKLADKNGDGLLNIEEFECFIHPEDCQETMRDLLITEGLENFDKDRDGKVSWMEYIGDVMNDEDKEEVKRGIEPEWMTAEKQFFKDWKDKDGDMVLNREEVGEWLYPTDYNHAEIEAKHLMDMADSDKDNKLTFDEILERHDLFAGSQATQYGGALKKVHDPSEL